MVDGIACHKDKRLLLLHAVVTGYSKGLAEGFLGLDGGHAYRLNQPDVALTFTTQRVLDIDHLAVPHARFAVQTKSTFDGLLAKGSVIAIYAGLVSAALGQCLGSSSVVVVELVEVRADADNLKLLFLLQCLLLLLVGLRAYLFYIRV